MHLSSPHGYLRDVSRHSLAETKPDDVVAFAMSRARRKRRSRLRVEGPLAPYFEPYSEYLASRGYSQECYWKKTFIVSDFSRWLGQRGIAVGEILTLVMTARGIPPL